MQCTLKKWCSSFLLHAEAYRNDPYPHDVFLRRYKKQGLKKATHPLQGLPGSLQPRAAQLQEPRIQLPLERSTTPRSCARPVIILLAIKTVFPAGRLRRLGRQALQQLVQQAAEA